MLQIVREALLNAIRHASAQVIRVDYQHSEKGEHLLTITDDGVGMNSTDVAVESATPPWYPVAVRGGSDGRSGAERAPP